MVLSVLADTLFRRQRRTNGADGDFGLVAIRVIRLSVGR